MSVSMLMAVWDANSGAQILGVRAFRGQPLPTLRQAGNGLIRFADKLNDRAARVRAFQDGAAMHLAVTADR